MSDILDTIPVNDLYNKKSDSKYDSKKNKNRFPKLLIIILCYLNYVNYKKNNKNKILIKSKL